MAEDLLIAHNPDPGSRLRYLLRLPLSGGLVFRTSGTWPRTNALYCHPVDAAEWPEEPDVVERVGVRSCVRRGAAIDLVVARARENRSQLVFTTARGREVVFWQSPRTTKQSKPNVRMPSRRAGGLNDLEIVVDTREHYPFRFSGQQTTITRRALAAGDYGIAVDGRLVAVVERKSIADLIASLTNGTLRYALGELSTVPRAAVVVEDRYSEVFKSTHVRPALVADGLAELQVRWPNVPIVFCGSRQLAEEYTYRYLAAARVWAEAEPASAGRTGTADAETTDAPPAPGPTTAEVRRWAIAAGFTVPPRGRLRPEIWAAFDDAQVTTDEASPADPGPAPTDG